MNNTMGLQVVALTNNAVLDGHDQRLERQNLRT